MTSALLIRLHPSGPWRFGPGDGGRDRLDALYRSDRLFSAVTLAFQRLGLLSKWLEATAQAETPAVVFSSLFPFQTDSLFVPPPATLWPPPAAAVRISSPVFSTKVRWSAARFVPLSLIETLLLGQRVLAEQWLADPESGCLLRRDRPQSSPFRLVNRSQAAVDRLTENVNGHSAACLEFEPGAGLWCAVTFQSDEAKQNWKPRLEAAFRLLADTGFGARRSSGWGQISRFEMEEGAWPAILLPKLNRVKVNAANKGSAVEETPLHWLLSLFTPGTNDQIDWSAGSYSLTVRGGRVESLAGSGSQKKLVRMVEEGSVLSAPQIPLGTAVDVAPEGFAHPVYRTGFALSIRMPVVQFAVVEDPASTDLEKALDEALKAAAEESVLAAAEEKAVAIAEQFESQAAVAAENETEPENTKAEAMPPKTPEENSSTERIEHTGATDQTAPQTPFDEAPTAASDQVPERLDVENTPLAKHDETEKPEESESGHDGV